MRIVIFIILTLTLSNLKAQEGLQNFGNLKVHTSGSLAVHTEVNFQTAASEQIILFFLLVIIIGLGHSSCRMFLAQ